MLRSVTEAAGSRPVFAAVNDFACVLIESPSLYLMPKWRYRAAQNEQWCLDAKSVSIRGCGGTSDITCARSNDGHGSTADDGSPVAAKFAQAVRMLAASACWSRFRGT